MKIMQISQNSYSFPCLIVDWMVYLQIVYKFIKDFCLDIINFAIFKFPCFTLLYTEKWVVAFLNVFLNFEKTHHDKENSPHIFFGNFMTKKLKSSF